jgi:hypothetical protein
MRSNRAALAKSIGTLTTLDQAKACASDAQAERAEAMQVELGAGPCMVAWRERCPVAVRDVEPESRWSQVAPALVVASLLRAAATATVNTKLAEQLQRALQHRILMEQAKGC